MYDFTVITLPGSFGSSAAAMIDLLAAASRMAPRYKSPVLRWRVCSLEGGLVRLQSGIHIETTRLPVHSRSDTSTWVIPGLGLATERAVSEGLEAADCQRLAQAIKLHSARGGAVAACCSAVFLLQQAGVLGGRRATTSWWLAPMLQKLAPDCQVDARRMVCADGAIITAGAAFAHTDLMLHLLRKQCGSQLTDALSRFLIVDAREAQAPYVMPDVLANGDALISQIVDRIERSLTEPPGVAALARELCVSERTLSRHVLRVTGQSTIALVQSVRLRRARVLLEQSRMPVEEVAAEVGYSDPTALRRMMRKLTGANPSRFRAASTAT